MNTYLLAAAVLVLLGIFWELSVLIRRFDRLSMRLLGRPDKKEGPTINVTVGTVSGGVAPVSVPSEKPSESEPEEDKSEEEEPEAPPTPEPQLPPPPPKTPFFASPVNRAPNGVGVVKCPKCSAENSSFRTECFNCGTKL